MRPWLVAAVACVATGCLHDWSRAQGNGSTQDAAYDGALVEPGADVPFAPDHAMQDAVVPVDQVATEAGPDGGLDAAMDAPDAAADGPVDSGNDAAEASCSSISTLHAPPTTGSTIYCPFSGYDGGANAYCAAQIQHCCETRNAGSGLSSCEPTSTACGGMNYYDWQCEDPVADCGSGQVCCAAGSFNLGAPGCGNYLSGFSGSQCAATCPTGQLQLCTTSMECGTGRSCFPVRIGGNQIGVCECNTCM